MRNLAILTALLVLASCASPVASEQPQPTPQVIFVTPEPTAKATPEPTPTPEAFDRLAYIAWLDGITSTLDATTAAHEAFWAADAMSTDELAAGMDAWEAWGAAQSALVGQTPDPCYAEGFTLWAALVNEQYHLWDVATDAMIAGGAPDYAGLNTAGAINALNVWLDSPEAC